MSCPIYTSEAVSFFNELKRNWGYIYLVFIPVRGKGLPFWAYGKSVFVMGSQARKRYLNRGQQKSLCPQ